MYITNLFYIYNYYVFLNKNFYHYRYNFYFDISFMTFKELIILYAYVCILQIS